MAAVWKRPRELGIAFLYASRKPSALVQSINCMIWLAMNSSISSMRHGADFGRKSVTDIAGVVVADLGRRPCRRCGSAACRAPVLRLWCRQPGRLPCPCRACRVRSTLRRERLRLLGQLFAGVFGKAGRGVQLAVGADAAGQIGDLVGLDQLPANLGDQLAADGKLFRHPAVRPVVMQLELHLDCAAAFAAGQRQAVKEVDAGDEIEGVGERAVDDLGADRSLAEHDGGGVTMEPVGDRAAARRRYRP